jgi:predicted small secreted protein
MIVPLGKPSLREFPGAAAISRNARDASGAGETQRLGYKSRREHCVKRLAMSLQENARISWNGVTLATLGLLLRAGSHTTAGFGQDLQSVGRDVQNSANKHNR